MDQANAPGASSKASQSYWVFQFVSDESNREIESGIAGSTVNWRLTAYKDSVVLGDIVFFWRASGPDSALVGWGDVTGPRFESEDERISRIPVTTRGRFDPPITKEEFQGHPVLASVPVVAGRQGTNFSLSLEQADALVDVLTHRGLSHPEVSRERLAASLQARIERGARDLAGVADALPDTKLRTEVKNSLADLTVAVLGHAPVGSVLIDTIRSLGSRMIVLQRDGRWSSRANVDSIVSQVADDLERLRSISTPSVAPLREVVATETQPQAAADASPAGMPKPQPAPAEVAKVITPAVPASTPVAPTDHWYCAWEKEDLIDIKPHVSNLARYISHQDLVPPRAIGIFGDWGSGKSFFLRALRSEIALYADQSRRARKTGENTVFCSHIVQIEFNAWHYVESNLWASIAGYVFEQLYSELQQSTEEDTGESELNALFKSLDIYKEAVAERDQLQNDADALTTARDEIEKKANAARLTRQQIATGIAGATKQAVEKAFAAIPQDQKEKLARAAALATIEAAEQAIDQANQVVQEGKSIFGRIHLAFQTWGATGIAAGFGILLVLLGIPALVAFAVDAWLPSVGKWIATAGSLVMTGSGVLTWLSGKAKTPLSVATGVLNILDNAEKEARSAQRTKLETASNELGELEKRIAAVDVSIVEQQRLIAEARDAIDPRNLGTKLKRFLEERARSRGYEEHLGLVTLVRRDFENLSNLMRKHWAQRLAQTPQAVIEADDTVGAKKERVPFIERIVLYIDDLDRCPPQKVVEVLQAVHLLLGFPLFVVVVAVDVRWVRESLLKHYPDLLCNAALPTDPIHLSPASVRAQADDYLEKIFQIPFRIPALNGDCAKKLIDGLLKIPVQDAAAANQSPGSVSVLDLAPRELTLYTSEQMAISALNRSIGVSPRRIRRFLDQYLIMRAGMDDGVVQLITNTTNQYQSILGLFAMLSGAANSAPVVLQRLYSELKNSSGGASISLGLGAWIKKNILATQTDAYELSALTSAAEYMDAAQPDRKKLADALVQWIPEVARYSFREVRL
jgi:hypothetical protein